MEMNFKRDKYFNKYEKNLRKYLSDNLADYDSLSKDVNLKQFTYFTKFVYDWTIIDEGNIIICFRFFVEGINAEKCTNKLRGL